MNLLKIISEIKRVNKLDVYEYGPGYFRTQIGDIEISDMWSAYAEEFKEYWVLGGMYSVPKVKKVLKEIGIPYINWDGVTICVRQEFLNIHYING